MWSQFFQRKEEKDYITEEVGTASIGIQGVLAYMEEYPSIYRHYFDSEIEKIGNKISVLEDKVNTLYQVIQNRKIIPIQNLRSTKLQLIAPLYVVSEYEDGVFVISSDDINLDGYGDTELNAIRDFCNDVEYLYFDLKQSKNKLGKIMKESWGFLKSIIKEL